MLFFSGPAGVEIYHPCISTPRVHVEQRDIGSSCFNSCSRIPGSWNSRDSRHAYPITNVALDLSAHTPSSITHYQNDHRLFWREIGMGATFRECRARVLQWTWCTWPWERSTGINERVSQGNHRKIPIHKTINSRPGLYNNGYKVLVKADVAMSILCHSSHWPSNGMIYYDEKSLSQNE